MTKWVFGAPGTGKTHKLLDCLREYLDEGIPTEKIAFVSFTREGAYHGIELARAEHGITKEECPYFCTIHALCKRISKANVFDEQDAKRLTQLCLKAGLEISQVSTFLEEYNLASNRYPSATEEELYTIVAEETNDSIIAMAKISDLYRAYKERFNKKDMFEILKLGLASEPLNIDVLIVDEAQDLTLLQWQILDYLCARATERVYAGDPQQSLYGWAGAKTELFFERRKGAEEVILPESHRCCEEVWDYVRQYYKANNNEELPVKSSGKHGFRRHITNKEDLLTGGELANWLDLAEQLDKSVLLLGLDKFYLKHYYRALSLSGFVYKFTPTYKNNKGYTAKDMWSVPQQFFTLHNGIIAEKKRLKGRTPRDEQKVAAGLLTFAKRHDLDVDKLLKYGMEGYGFRWLIEYLRQIKTLEWKINGDHSGQQIMYLYPRVTCLDGLDNIDERTIQYWLAIEDRYRNRYIPKKYLTISTIHAKKGAEADLVILNTDVSTKRKVDIFELNKIFYVGASRAKEGLVTWQFVNYNPYFTALQDKGEMWEHEISQKPILKWLD